MRNTVLALFVVAWKLVGSSSAAAIRTAPLQSSGLRLPSSSSACNVNLDAVVQLAKRYIPPVLVDSDLRFESLSLCKTKETNNTIGGDDDDVDDVFEYGNDNDDNNSTDHGEAIVVIRGSSTSALTSGLGWYLKYEAKRHLSWTGDNLNFNNMTKLPLPAHKVRKTRQGQFSYYQNVCTVSYSMVWWDLERWHRELDWMALAGINMPLAFIGQEIVWLQLFQELGLETDDILRFFGGPAFMAWQRMGNIQEWGGPMPIEWIKQQHQLQLGILKRARELGMIPVLPAFGGFVPPEMTRLYPKANIILSDRWGGFNTSYTPVHLVEVTDPLFQTIGKMFLKKLTELYGTDHYYNAGKKLSSTYKSDGASSSTRTRTRWMYSQRLPLFIVIDTFNEMNPSSGDLDYLTAAAKAVSSSIRSVDPDGIWVMQGWLFANSAQFWTNERIFAYLSGAPDDGMLILDLQSERSPQYKRTDYYYGKLFVYSMLHNFGGNHGLYGAMQVISTNPPELFKDSNSTVAGVGLTMEGINQNFVVYDLMTEMAWRTEVPDLEIWAQEYAFRRYGSSSVFIDMAWVQLLNTVYTCRTQQAGVTKSLAVKRPGTSMMKGGFMPTELFYDPKDLVIAWGYLLKAFSNTIYIETYRYDLVDVTRQVLSDMLIPTYQQMLKSFELGQRFDFQVQSERFLGLLDDMDKIVRSSDFFLLEHWLASARSRGRHNNTLAALYEFNARNQITLWGPNGEINDYASKQFGGLISSYYRPRWALFIRYLTDALDGGTNFDGDGFSLACLRMEQSWQRSRERYSSEPTGDTYKIAIQLYGNYEALIMPLLMPDNHQIK
jgi:alpha-N-acetylglucosaminidase